MKKTVTDVRQCALTILQAIGQHHVYSDIALDQGLRERQLSPQERGLVTEFVYGIVRRQRSLDALIDQLANTPPHQQPPNLRLILRLGLYQLRYLSHIPPSAAVNTSVELAKKNGFKGLAGVVNGILRQYLRLSEVKDDPLILPSHPVQRLGILYSFPDWLIELWLQEWGETETEALCQAFNQVPSIDLRINPLKNSLDYLKNAFTSANIPFSDLDFLPNGLRLTEGNRQIRYLPLFAEGGWIVQEASAQLVGYLLDPQPEEVIIDACAAPGGKTTHIAELMGDTGIIWACDRTASRLKKVQQNMHRLQLQSIRLQEGDSREYPLFREKANRVLLDVPCSGLGTLHRHPEIRWRQNPEKIQELAQLQKELLAEAATWVKPQGVLVYATCTLNKQENENVVLNFLENHPQWRIEFPAPSFPAPSLVSETGWLKILPHRHQMDGFFMVKLRKNSQTNEK